MPENLEVIYQSGEKIPFSGTFEVVGVRLAHAAHRNEQSRCELKAGEVFAAYEGMEVCWHLISRGGRQDAETSGIKQ